MTSMEPIAVRVIGIGNVLMGDDGVGPLAVEGLRARYDLPEQVQLVDAGTPGPDLAYLLRGVPAVIVVDAVRAAAHVGEVRTIRRGELGGVVASGGSAHDPTLVQSLALLELLGEGPGNVTLVGITIAGVAPAPGPSPEVAAALPELIDRVASLLRELGYPPVPRASPSEPGAWWL